MKFAALLPDAAPIRDVTTIGDINWLHSLTTFATKFKSWDICTTEKPVGVIVRVFPEARVATFTLSFGRNGILWGIEFLELALKGSP